ncbi:hypothetical protein [Myroides odoratus]|uniref:Methylthioribulose-1-phosphate dehydratase n=1 Tax=Myroides odoratus TaxID=256 RepID=A0A378RKP1_MYROD|nr:hypothetical protein [Myroides odoratus]STZ27555.1 methylthioribulose-1-phosphate dehydratase [Myroides odoratus]
MIRKVIPLMALFATGFATAQVGIGTVTPANSSQLDIVSDKKGVLFPRVNLKGERDKDPIVGDLTESLFVYNLGHGGLPAGFYYWDKEKWVRLLNTQSYVNTTNVSFTLINDDLTITDSEGNTVSMGIDEIVNNSNFITEIINKLQGKFGNVYYNTVDHKFYYIDENGAPNLITWEDLNTTNVSFTLENDYLTVTDLDRSIVQLHVDDIANNLTFVTKLAENQNFITEIMNKLKGKYGNVVYNATENKYYYIKEDGTQEEIDWSSINTTNVSFTLENDKLTVKDSDGNKIQLDVKDIANNTVFISELTNNEDFVTTIVNKLKGKYGNVFYDVTNNKFYYIKDDGTQGEIDWSSINTTNVSFTLDVDMLTITDSDGNTVQLDVKEIANNSTFITELTNNEEFVTAITNNNEFITEIINKLKGKYGNVFYDVTNNKFYYIKDDGTQGEIDWSSINTTNVSFTLDADMLTVTDSDGNKVQLDVKEIANNSTFITELANNEEFVTAITNNNEFITEIINKLKGKYGNVFYDVTNNKFYYIKDDGTQGEIDWSSINTTNVSFTLDADMLTVTDSDGNKVQLDVKEIANNSTFITELTNNEEFVTAITNNNEFITEIINKLKGKYGNVFYDVTNNKFYYIKDDGTQGEIDWSSINTTNVSFTLDADMLTVTDSDGNKVQLDVKEIANNSTFITELTSNEEFITNLTSNETLITQIVNKLKGKYGNVFYDVTNNKFYYIKDDGTQGEIDWSSINTTNVSFTLDADMLTVTDSDGNKVQLDVKEIANNSTFITELTSNEEFITNLTSNETLITQIVNKLKGKYGNVFYDVTNNKFYYIKDDGTQGEIDWSSINTTNVSFTLDADMLTITDSDGNTVQLDVKEIANNSTFITELTSNEEFITNLTSNETLITQIVNKLKGKYGNVFYDVTNNKFYYIKDDGTQGEIDWSSINTTNVSFTLDADMLTVTDSDGNKVQLDVKEIANNSTFITELTSNEEFITNLTSNETLITQIVNKLKGKYGNVFYDVTNNKFYYIKDDGTQGEIDWSSINTTNVSFTLDADMLTVTDSDGNKVQLDVKEIANNSTFITELTSNEEFITNLTSNETLITQIVNKLKGKYGNVFYDVTNNKFYYIKDDGTQGEIDWSSINTTNVSFTLDADMLTITDSDGNTVQLDVKEIANNSTFVNELTNNEEFVTNIVSKLKGKYGNVFYNVTDSKFYYIKEDGSKEEVDWSSINTTNTSFTLDANMLTITDSDGNTVQLDVKEIASNTTFVTEVINQLKDQYGNVYYDVTNNKYYYIKEDGSKEEVDLGSTTLAGDVTGATGATTLSKIQGNPVSAATVADGQALVFDGTSWVPGTPEVDVTKITAGKELKSDASITVTNGTGTLLKEASIKVADDGITTAHIKDGTILLEDMARSLSPNQVLVTNGSNIPSWADQSVLSASPWLVQGSSTIATLNTQNIYQTGTIAIGASQIPATETTAKLFVAGDVVTTGKYFTTNAVYADYVFEKYFTGSSDIKLTYKFNTLTDIARFVKENHHLPGVTPISELNKNESGYGFDLTNLSVELLEKVEELFLHTIEQQDQIDQLKKEQATVLERLEKLEKLVEKK